MSKRLWGGLAVALLAALCLTPNMARADDAAPVPIDEEHFPDPAFREFVIYKYDGDKDGLLTADDLAKVTYMDCSNEKSDYIDKGKRLASLKGIEYFTSLTDLNCEDNEIVELDVSKNTELVELDCSINKIKSLDISRNAKLEDLIADHNNLEQLYTGSNTAIKMIDCYCNKLTELDLSANTALDELTCYSNKLTRLALPSSIYKLECQDNQLTSLDLSSRAGIHYVDCHDNRIASISLDGCGHLSTLYCYNNLLASLNVSNIRELNKLNCSNNRIASLELKGNAGLYELECSNNPLTSLDLSECASDLYKFNCENCALTIDVGVGRTFGLDALPGRFDTTKASDWKGGTVSDGILTVENGAASVTYQYDCGLEQTATFTLDVGYSVSFDTGGGSKVHSQTVIAGEKASKPESDPIWEQHVFDGWYADEKCTQAYDFETMTVTGPTTVYAKWEEDAEAPAIDGIEDGRTYCAAQKATVADKHPGTVTVNGAAVELGEDGSFTLSPAAGEQKVVAADRAGNVTTVTVTVNDGHTWDEGWSHDATHHWRVCSVCGEKGDVAEHAGGTATCSSKATCEVCGEEYGKLDPSRHEHTETLPAKAATCTEDGLTEGSKCTDCGEVLVEQKAVPASGHKGGTATCSKKAECETCGEEYGKLDPENHEALERVEAKEATTEAEGNVEYWRCTGCGKLFSDAAGTKKIERADTVIPKLDPKKDEGDKTDDGNGGQGGDNGSNGGGSNASNGSADGTSGGTTTKTTVTTVTAAGKAGSGLAQTGDPSAAAAGIALAAGLAALGAALLRSKRCDF